ncbi:MAG: transporter [Candidatus Eisenbacteria bacterium]|uniref:Transporter n=1 Tax=Eiseniibacteriota bacterium TaxID=2212470 RepID=A0A538T2H1_UNCEI|nr:MAG: transporter [Candidatus Eisenbacteria bacterium]
MSARPEPAPLREEDLHDLGFGAVVARESRERLLNKDGSFNVERRGRGFLASISPYHALITMPWRAYFALVVGAYLLTNLLFAAAYELCGPGALEVAGRRTMSFLEAFFFSVQTLATIGYGRIAPVGLAANVLVTLESLVGLLGFALATGILFARFSRPMADVVFSHNAIIAPYRDRQAFEFRIANRRRNEVLEVQAEVVFSRIEGAERMRRFYVLPLEREKVVFFPLSWTVVHAIDEKSPLHGLTQRDLADSDAEFLVLLTGIDEGFSQTVLTRSSYKPEEIVWNAKFTNIFRRARDGRLSIDVSRIHEIERRSKEVP